jgi:cytochrome c
LIPMKKAASLVCAAVMVAGFAFAADEKKGDVEKGKETFEQCAACHNVDSPDKKMGPSLQGLYKRKTLKNGKAVTDANVKAIINAGGNGMPAYADLLSDEERADIIAYLKTL